MPAPDVEAVHLARRLVLLDNGTVRPIATLLDCLGEETAAEREAVSAIVEAMPGVWLCVDLRTFEAAPLH
ncbi:hypothetical protein [Ancylobacter rudongensis]|uniref:Uncharacterized protein n=1 Tax=Ancylobacter rudongensis TaxID=177413 RepID=A0A1G4UPI2_9HYPH|nr:hypothetical protein [Ancylobacter rudongensis]SCW95548.1 hypothetical protein SAMN05660859_0052 [Ancylobacter rudongensis]